MVYPAVTFLNKFSLPLADPVTRSKDAETDSNVSDSATESDYEETDADGVDSNGTISRDKGELEMLTLHMYHGQDTHVCCT